MSESNVFTADQWRRIEAVIDAARALETDWSYPMGIRSLAAVGRVISAVRALDNPCDEGAHNDNEGICDGCVEGDR